MFIIEKNKLKIYFYKMELLEQAVRTVNRDRQFTVPTVTVTVIWTV